MATLLERFEEICARLGYDSGYRVPIPPWMLRPRDSSLIIRVAGEPYEAFVSDESREVVVLRSSIPVPTFLHDLYDGFDDEQRRWLDRAVLENAFANLGRTGFHPVPFEASTIRAAEHLVLRQKFVVMHIDAATMQRVQDGVQEILALKLRTVRHLATLSRDLYSERSEAEAEMAESLGEGIEWTAIDEWQDLLSSPAEEE